MTFYGNPLEYRGLLGRPSWPMHSPLEMSRRKPALTQMVNWDIAKERLHETTASIETGWNRLKSSFRSL